jgi:hypothetical protein
VELAVHEVEPGDNSMNQLWKTKTLYENFIQKL